MLWSDMYKTGSPSVDGQHMEIFEMVRELQEIDLSANDVRERLEQALEFLSAYAVRHFSNEETLMLQSNYSGYAMHKSQHDTFVVDLVRVMRQNGAANDMPRLVSEITAFASSWLKEHIASSDKHMATHYREWEANKLDIL